MKVVIIEDDRTTALLLKAHFEDRGDTVIPCVNVREALSYLERELPDVAIVDVTLPDGDGKKIVEAIRDRPQGARVIVVIYSATDPQSLGQIQGADVVIQKSSDLRELLNVTASGKP